MLLSGCARFLPTTRDLGVTAPATQQPAAWRTAALAPSALRPLPGAGPDAASGHTQGPSSVAVGGCCLALAGVAPVHGLARKRRRAGAAQRSRGQRHEVEAAQRGQQFAYPVVRGDIGGATPPTEPAPPKRQPKLQFASGDSINSARRLAESRKFIVAPWNQDVLPRPILAVSDGRGEVLQAVVRAAFPQFGKIQKLRMSLRLGLKAQEEVDDMLQTALQLKDGPALVVCTMSNEELDAYLRAEAAKLGVPCVNAMEGPLTAMRRRFAATNGLSDSLGDLLEPTVFAVSDTTCTTASEAAKAAVQEVVAAKGRVKTITVCPKVNSLEEVVLIAQNAFATGSVVVFSLASPGLSRFMRMQCERLKVVYADLLQPVVMAMEQYLEYPAVGVPGGLDLKKLETSDVSWREEEV